MYKFLSLILIIFNVASIFSSEIRIKNQIVDHRYSPSEWVAVTSLPDDNDKALVHKDGTLMYDYYKKFFGLINSLTIDKNFALKINAGIDGKVKFISSSLYSSKVPIVQNEFKRDDGIRLKVEIFRDASSCNQVDLIILNIKNESQTLREVTPYCSFKGRLNGRTWTTIHKHQNNNKGTIHFESVDLMPGEEAFRIVSIFGKKSNQSVLEIEEALHKRKATIFWWKNWDKFGSIKIPDKGIQDLLNSSIRNIYQARVIVQGRPEYRVGCCVYNNLWVIDNAFLMEAVLYLGNKQDARSAIEKMMSRQKKNGSLYYINFFHKEHGIALWTIYRHAILTDDKDWLKRMWSKFTKLVTFIKKLRKLGNGLMPIGYIDGGLKGPYFEYSNDYWSLIGLKYAIEAAQWLGKIEESKCFEMEFNNYLLKFHNSRRKNMKVDQYGNRYLPIVRGILNKRQTVTSSQYAFLHSIFPGRLFHPKSEFVKGQMKMLQAAELEGIPVGSGWNKKGVWTYLASFYGHAWLDLGNYIKSIKILYHFANHSSPLYTWIEEQNLKSDSRISLRSIGTTGDMPHNWASAEFIRFLRHSILLEKGKDLYLFEGLPKKWVQSGKKVVLNKMLTVFGQIDLILDSCEGGSNLILKLNRNRLPKKIFINQNAWGIDKRIVLIPTDDYITYKLESK